MVCCGLDKQTRGCHLPDIVKAWEHSVASGLKLVMGHKQGGKQIELTIIYNKEPSSQTERALHG